MKKNGLPDWEKYWSNFNDKEQLLYKSDNLDETLQLLEQEFDTKLLSGDHMLILDALDYRINELERMETSKKNAMQTSLFDDL